MTRQAILLDIDDTLINTDTRRYAVWRYIGLNVTPTDVESLSSKELLKKYSHRKQDLLLKFWRYLLCIDQKGIDFLKFDQPIPHAVDIVQQWSTHHEILYLTGRTENMRELTINELRSFGFPVDDNNLFMCSELELFLNAPLEVRQQLLNYAISKMPIVCVVDDYPSYFPIYHEYQIPVRIGLLRSKRFKPEDYTEAIIVVTEWSDLKTISLK